MKSKIWFLVLLTFMGIVMIAYGGDEKLDPTVNWPVGLQAEYGDTLADIELPGNSTGTAGVFTWTTPNSLVGNTGVRSHSVTFTPADTVTYNKKTQNVQVWVRLLISFVWVEAGTFTMGPDIWNNNATVEVTFTNGFNIGKYPVTQEQYEKVMGVNPNHFTTAQGRAPETGETDERRPVETVRWYHAIAFCNRLSILEGLTPVYSIDAISNTDADAWLHTAVPTSNNATWNVVTANWTANGYRLPTDAQWEFAARGGNESEGYTYSGSNNADEVAWHWENSGSKTREVGKKLPNELGIYDMSGNVWEWCWDWWGNYPSSAVTDYTGVATGSSRVRRGGSWSSTAAVAQSVSRSFIIPDYRHDYLGFRLLRP
jgi:formylglycine-generating enzyme required for sulfatase activity